MPLNDPMPALTTTLDYFRRRQSVFITELFCSSPDYCFIEFFLEFIHLIFMRHFCFFANSGFSSLLPFYIRPRRFVTRRTGTTMRWRRKRAYIWAIAPFSPFAFFGFLFFFLTFHPFYYYFFFSAGITLTPCRSCLCLCSAHIFTISLFS